MERRIFQVFRHLQRKKSHTGVRFSICNSRKLKDDRILSADHWGRKEGNSRILSPGRLLSNMIQFSSVAQSCLAICDAMNCSTPGLPVHHQLSELAQTHVHQVGDTIQPSHPLLSPSPPAFNLSQHQVFSSESVPYIRWPKYWNFSFSISPSNEYSGLIAFRIYWLESLQSKGLSRVFSNTIVQKHQFFSAQLSL